MKKKSKIKKLGYHLYEKEDKLYWNESSDFDTPELKNLYKDKK